MLSKYRQKRQEGFTIIEVLIVLAIAGLILLVVFLAVPALQRNARNTQRKTDVQNMLGGMAEYVNNNNGTLPTAITTTATSVTLGGGVSSVNQVEVNLSYYGGSNITIDTDGVASNPSNQNNVVIVTGAECSGNDAVAGPSRGYVALYELESNAEQCQAS